MGRVSDGTGTDCSRVVAHGRDVGLGEVGLAQETDTKWLIGVWTGEQTRVPWECRSEVEFNAEGGAIGWEITVLCMGRELRGRGSAKVSGDTVEMKGQYYAGEMGNLLYSVTRNGNLLEGTGNSAMNVPFRVSWGKVK